MDDTLQTSHPPVENDFFDDSPTVTVRLSDIVAFEPPLARLVDVHLAQLRAGKPIEPLRIDSEWVEHWHEGNDQQNQNYLGMGYALLEGNDRHAALVAHFGAHAECEVIMQGLRPIKGWKAARP